jgi:hypothetical protein
MVRAFTGRRVRVSGNPPALLVVRVFLAQEPVGHEVQEEDINGLPGLLCSFFETLYDIVIEQVGKRRPGAAEVVGSGSW